MQSAVSLDTPLSKPRMGGCLCAAPRVSSFLLEMTEWNSVFLIVKLFSHLGVVTYVCNVTTLVTGRRLRSSKPGWVAGDAVSGNRTNIQAKTQIV